MNELKKGYFVSGLVHALILAPIFITGRIMPDPQQQPLDIGFSFHIKPLGNSLEKPSSQQKSPPQQARKDSSSEKGPGESQQTQDAKRYGASDGSADVDEFYVMENYRSIMAIIGNRLIYPGIARDNGWQGKVLVSFVIGTDGKITDILVKQGSGYAILDTSAIKTIQSIHGIPAPRRPTRVTVPISFVLN